MMMCSLVDKTLIIHPLGRGFELTGKSLPIILRKNEGKTRIRSDLPKIVYKCIKEE